MRDIHFQMKKYISTPKANYTQNMLLAAIFIIIFKPYRFSSNNREAGEKK